MSTYNVNYSCGCVHEIEAKPGIHVPTGVQTQCRSYMR